MFSFRDGATGPIVLTREDIPFFGNGVRLRTILLHGVNNRDEILMSGLLVGGPFGSEGQQTVLIQRNQTFEIVVQSGDPAPIELPDIVIDSARGALINESGVVVFCAILTGEGIDRSNDSALFRYFNGEITLLAHEGQRSSWYG